MKSLFLRTLPLLAAAILCTSQASSQSMTALFASGLPSGANQMCFLGTDANNNAISYSPQGGSSQQGPVCFAVSGGMLTNGSFVANVATANPSSLLYRVTIINGNTVYLVISQVLISGAVWNFNNFGLASNQLAVGIGLPTLACAYGAAYTATNLPDGQNGLFCNVNGQWQGQPANPYCPVGQGYLVPTATGKPSCLPPSTEGLGSPTGSCFEKQRYTQSDAGDAFDWGCVNGAWRHASGPIGPQGNPGVASVVTSNGTNGGFAVPGTLSNGAGGPPTLPSDPTVPLQAATKAYTDNTRGGVWQRIGTVMRGTVDHEWAVQEHTEIWDTNPHILGEPADGSNLYLFKSWHVCGWLSESLCYAESYDGITWTHRSTPVIAYPLSVSHGFVFKDGGQYLFYAANSPVNATAIDRWTSPDGITWTHANSAVISSGPNGTWDAGPLGNIYVSHQGSIYYAVYEAESTSAGPYISGVATSSDGITWTKYSGNPVITGPNGGAAGGPELHLVNGVWHMWGQCSSVSTSEPTDLCRWDSSDFYHWTLFGTVLNRANLDEGWDRNDALGGQLGDPSIVEVAGRTYLFFTAVRSQDTPTANNNGVHIKLAIANLSLAQVVATNEGGASPIQSSADQAHPSFYRTNYYETPYEDDNGEQAIGDVTIAGGSYPGTCLNCYYDPIAQIARYAANGSAAKLILNKAGGSGSLEIYPGGVANQPLGTDTNIFVFSTSGFSVSRFDNYYGLERASGVAGSGCSNMSAGTSCGVVLTLSVGFPNTNYSVFGCTVTSAPAGTVLGRVSSLAGNSFSVDEVALTAGAGGGTINCLVMAN